MGDVDLDGLVAALSTPGPNTTGGAPARDRAPHTSPEFKGFHPGMTVDDDGNRVVTTPDVLEVLHDESQWRQLCERLGFTVPDGWTVRLTEMRHDPAAWHRDKPGEDAVTRPVWRYRFKIEPGGGVDVDAVALLKALGRRRTPPKRRFVGSATFCVSFNDWQAGKSEGGGSAALAGRLDAAFHDVLGRALELRGRGYQIGRLLVVGNGDMVEGCAMFPNHEWQVDLNRRAQVNLTTGLILRGLDVIATRFDDVDVIAVGGNHGEHRRDGRMTTRDDNDDVAVFEHAARAANRDPSLQHVRFHIEPSDPAIALDVGPWRVAATHGHVFGKGAGPIEKKAWDWYCRKSAQRHPAGQADLLLTAHWHHFAVRDFGQTMWVQAPAMDGGSAWFTDWSGQAAAPSMLTWLMTDDSRFTEPHLVGGVS